MVSSTTRHRTPIEIWGSLEAVAKGVEAHNAVTRDVARSNSHVILVDLDARCPVEANFDDVCHLTDPGCEVVGRPMDEPLRRRMTGVIACAASANARSHGPHRRRRHAAALRRCLRGDVVREVVVPRVVECDSASDSGTAT